MSQKKARSRRRAIRDYNSRAQFAGENAAIATLAGITLLSRAHALDGFVTPGFACLSLADANDVSRLLFALASDSMRADLAELCFFASGQLDEAILAVGDDCAECSRVCVSLPDVRAVAELLHALPDSARDAGLVCECFAAGKQLAELPEEKHA